jgi:hypothetical protein
MLCDAMNGAGDIAPAVESGYPANQLALAKQVNWLGIWLVIY